MEKINERNQLRRNGGNYTKVIPAYQINNVKIMYTFCHYYLFRVSTFERGFSCLVTVFFKMYNTNPWKSIEIIVTYIHL